MSVNVIAELHPARRTRVNITASPKPIADIVRELNSGFPLSQARVCRNGEIVKDFSIMANDGDMLAIKFVPYGSPQETGSGMKAGGMVLAIIGFAIGAGFSWTGVGAAAGVALIGAGIGMLAGGTALMNINIPSMKDREKPEQDPSIRGGKNQSRPHGRIPVLFGRHRIYPDLAANPHTTIIGNAQFFTQLFCGGYKDCVIDLASLKLGDTPLVDLSHTKNIDQILAGADPLVRLEILQNGAESELYPHCVHEDMINAELKNMVEDGEGNRTPGEIIRDTPDNTDKINVDIFFYNGLGAYDDQGNLGFMSVEVKASYKNADDDSPWQSLGFFNNDTNIIYGAELKTKRCQITKEGLEPGKYKVKIERVSPDFANSKIIDQVYVGSIRSMKSARPIRAERQQNLTIIALRVMATAKVSGIVDSFNYIATSKLPVYSGNGGHAGSGALYWLDAAQTRNPAAALLYALQGTAAQQSVEPGDIDWPSLETFFTWCEQTDDDGDYRYTCDAYISESVTIAELIRMIGSTARADILRIDSKISVVQDIKRPSPMQLFTPKNSISYSIAMFSADIPDAIALRFIDEEAGYAHNELRVYNTAGGNPVTGAEPDTVQKVDLWGVTNSKQARRIGMYNYACLKNRPFVHTVEVDIEYLLCNKGDWIQYAGDIALAGSTQGRIKGVIWVDGVCIGIDTDEPMVMTEGNQYAVRIRRSDGTIILKDVVFSLGKRHEKSITYRPGENEKLYEPFIGKMYAVDENDNVYYEPENILFFIEPFEEADAPKAGDIYAFGVRDYEALDLIITDIAPGQNLTAVLTCVEYSPEIFGVDQSGFILPDFVNRITPVSGAADSGVVNPDRWRSFFTYHDDEDEPARPSGDGQGRGWHHIETFRSVWQSTKTAESVESGEWGLPVRIRAERGSDDVTPIWLSLLPQNITLETDGGGNVLAGLLPFTVQARLFKWNSLLTDVRFFLVGAPLGVSINLTSGVLTVSAAAVLGETNKITVRAEYQGAAYTATLCIDKSVNNFAPRYLGTVEALSTSPTVIIIKGPAIGIAQARQGDYVLAVAAAGGRLAGSVFQWSGAAWEYRPPQNYANLYINCFKDGLDVPALSRDIGWFGGVMAGLICAQAGFIEKLESQVIKLNMGGVIYGGNKFLENGNVNAQAAAGAKGFWLGANGEVKLEKATVSGDVTAESGVFHGRIEAEEGYFKGRLVGAEGDFSGTLNANNIDMNGVHRVGNASTEISNPYTVAYDNKPTNNKNAINLSPFGYAVKVLRIAGRGNIRLRAIYRGRVGYFVQPKNGASGTGNSYYFPNHNTLSEGWSNEIVSLPDDINIIYMYAYDWDQGGGTVHTFDNTIFEARTSNNPGLFRDMSSPF